MKNLQNSFKTVNIDENCYKDLKEYCTKRGLKISKFLEILIQEKLYGTEAETESKH